MADDLLETELDLGLLSDFELFHFSSDGQGEFVLLFEENIAGDFEMGDLKES